MSDDWARLIQTYNPGETFRNAYAQGVQQHDQTAAKNALATLVQNPNDPQALAALAKVDPQAAMQFRTQQAELTKQNLAQHQDSILKGAEILRQFNPKDQASYSAALQAAQRAGIDVSQVPQQYSPQYVDGVIHLADALKPQTGENMHFITPQPGGGAFGYDPRTGQTTTIIAPNGGGQQFGAPAGGAPQVLDQASYDAVPPGATYMTPDGHTRVKQGGQMGAAPSGGFPQ